MLRKLWSDESGVVTLEYLILCTLLGLALMFGVTGLAAAINAEMLELGNAILGLNQSYSVSGVSSCNYTSGASGATDNTQTPMGSNFAVPYVSTSNVIDVIVCP